MRFLPVTSLLLRRRRLLVCACAALAMLLFGCIFDGGTDTPNGVAPDKNLRSILSARIVDSSGHPVAGITVAVFDTGFRPDAGKAQDSLLVNASLARVSDTAGLVDISLRKAGVYVLAGTSGGATVFFDTLRIGNPTAAATLSFAVRQVKAFKGQVRLASGMHVDSGAVFVRGTGRWAKVAADGSYDLGILPVDAVRMAVGLRYAASPTSVRLVNQIIVRADTSKVDTTKPIVVPKDTIKYNCKDVPKDSAAKQIASSYINPANSTIDPGKAALVPVTLDTGRINAALKSCDTLPTGSLVNVKVPDSTKSVVVGKPDSVSVPYLIVVNPPGPDSSNSNRSSFVVSFSQCVEQPGTERTTFAVQFQTTELISDLLVGDLAVKCVKP